MIQKKENFIILTPPKITSVCSVKDLVARMKSQAIDWEKIFANNISNIRPVFSYIKHSLKTQQQKKQSSEKMANNRKR